MNILKSPTGSNATRIIRGMVACMAVTLGTTVFAAQKVDVYLTGFKFGAGKTIHATSGDKTIVAATGYTYKLSGKVRGTPGTPLAKVVQIQTDLADFIDYVSPGGSSFLTGSFSNPSGLLPATVIKKTFSGTRKVKGYGNVKMSVTIVGTIEADGKCVLDIKNVKFKTDPPQNLGSVVFSKGSALTITAVP